MFNLLLILLAIGAAVYAASRALRKKQVKASITVVKSDEPEKPKGLLVKKK